MFKSFFEQCTDINLISTTEEIIVSGDWAFDRGPYTVTFTPKAGGEPMRDSGRGMDFFKRQPDGSWKTYREIWNND